MEIIIQHALAVGLFMFGMWVGVAVGRATKETKGREG